MTLHPKILISDCHVMLLKVAIAMIPEEVTVGESVPHTLYLNACLEA